MTVSGAQSLPMLWAVALVASALSHPYSVADLSHVARNGNHNRLLALLSSAPVPESDLNRVLIVAAMYSRIPSMKILIAKGATDLDTALLGAAMRNQMAAVRFLVSPERTTPATDMARAVQIAGMHGAVDAEFYLLTVMRHAL